MLLKMYPYLWTVWSLSNYSHIWLYKKTETYHFNAYVKNCLIGEFIVADLMNRVDIIAVSSQYNVLVSFFESAVCEEMREPFWFISIHFEVKLLLSFVLHLGHLIGFNIVVLKTQLIKLLSYRFQFTILIVIGRSFFLSWPLWREKISFFAIDSST
jgi:hypothetical protein